MIQRLLLELPTRLKWKQILNTRTPYFASYYILNLLDLAYTDS